MDEKELLKLYRRVEFLENWVHAQQRFGPAYKGIVADFMFLPYLRGFWPMVSINEAPAVIDYSGQGRNLTINGGAGLTETSNNNMWYFDLDGTNDYLSRADEAGLDLTGNMTVGGWFWFDDNLTRTIFASKSDGTTANTNWWMERTNTNVVYFLVGDGVSTFQANSAAVTTAAWHFVVGRYTTSTEVATFVDNVKTTNTTSIPASLQNSTAQLSIGALNGASLWLDGRVAFPFICGSALSDNVIYNLYHRSWPLLANST